MSKIGIILSLIYIIASAVLVASQGLTGESFIAIILGLPWSLLFAFFEYGNVSGALLNALLIAPMILNALMLYWIGKTIERRAPRMNG